jgi:hypothetical protein
MRSAPVGSTLAAALNEPPLGMTMRLRSTSFCTRYALRRTWSDLWPSCGSFALQVAVACPWLDDLGRDALGVDRELAATRCHAAARKRIGGTTRAVGQPVSGNVDLKAEPTIAEFTVPRKRCQR